MKRYLLMTCDDLYEGGYEPSGAFATIKEAIREARHKNPSSARLYDKKTDQFVTPFRWRAAVPPPRRDPQHLTNKFFPDFLGAVPLNDRKLFIEATNRSLPKTTRHEWLSIESGGIDPRPQEYKLALNGYEMAFIAAHSATGIPIPEPLVSVTFQPITHVSTSAFGYQTTVQNGKRVNVIEKRNYGMIDRRTRFDLTQEHESPWWDEETMPWPKSPWSDQS